MPFKPHLIWRTGHARRLLLEPRVEEHTVFCYVLAAVLLQCLMMSFHRVSMWQIRYPVILAGTVAYFAAIVGSLVWIYRSNGGRHGTQFLTRYLLLSVPIYWKIALAQYLVYLIGWTAVMHYELGSVAAQLNWAVSGPFWVMVMAWRLAALIRPIAAHHAGMTQA